MANPIDAVLTAVAAYVDTPSGPDLPPLYEALEDAVQNWRAAGAPLNERTDHVALRQAAINLVNQLTALRMPDESTLWRMGGAPLDRDYRALKAALISTDQAPIAHLVAAARAAGAAGTWVIRGATWAELLYADEDADTGQALRLTPPHDVIVLISIPTLPGGPDGIEFHGPEV